MNGRDYAALAASVLRRRPESRRETTLTRDRGIAIIAQAMRQSSRGRRRGRAMALGFAAAAAAALVSTALLRHGVTPKPNQQAVACVDSSCKGKLEPLASVDVAHVEGRDLLPGNAFRVRAAEPVRVQFDSGTRMALDPNTELTYDEGSATHRFSMSRGAVHLEVAKLSTGQRFLLSTLDAEVEVRGTVFDVQIVEPAQACGQRTRVSVKEGVVQVRSAALLHILHAGEHWPSDCQPAQHEAEHKRARAGAFEHRSSTLAETAPIPVASATAAAVPAQAEVAAKDASSLPPDSALAIQNDLYARASAERRLGHVSEALALYQQLIARFPGSALLESAYVQRLRLLRQSHSSQASAEAQRYLERFPQGFARAEAEELSKP